MNVSKSQILKESIGIKRHLVELGAWDQERHNIQKNHINTYLKNSTSDPKVDSRDRIILYRLLVSSLS